MGLEVQGTVAAEMVSSDIGANAGHPLVRLGFEYWPSGGQAIRLLDMERRNSQAFAGIGRSLSDRLPAAACATFGPEELAFFAAGGAMQLVVVLKSVDGDVKADFSREIVNLTVNFCEAS